MKDLKPFEVFGYTVNDRIEVNKRVFNVDLRNEHPWHRDLYIELTEAVETGLGHADWKLDKGSRDNLLPEMIDVYSFLFNYAICEAFVSNTEPEYDGVRREVVESLVIGQMLEAWRDALMSSVDYVGYSEEDRVEELGHMLDASVASAAQREDVSMVASYIFRVFILLGVSINDIHAEYIAKTVLCEFRADNGYRTGAYKKDWSGKDDAFLVRDMLKVINTPEATLNCVQVGLKKELDLLYSKHKK